LSPEPCHAPRPRIVRDSYGDGEHGGARYHPVGADDRRARSLHRPIGNLSMTLPDETAARRASSWVRTSTACRRAATFDGAAESSPAYPCCRGEARAIMPDYDLSVMAIARRSPAWFDIAYLGSGGAFGLLDPACLSIPRSDNGQSLEATLKQRGFDPSDPGTAALLDPSGIRAYLELPHRAGPDAGRPGTSAAVVERHKRCKRFRNARCIGEYAHSGAVGRPTGPTAVAATSPFFTTWRASGCSKKRPARIWLLLGELFTDPHARTEQVAGETRFGVDLRSLSDTTTEVVAARRALRGADQCGLPRPHRSPARPAILLQE